MAKKREYPRRFVPRQEARGWRYQAGDGELLKLLYEYRLLNHVQLAKLVGRNGRSVQRRLRFMFDAKPQRLVLKPPKQHHHIRDPGPDIFALANAGAETLAKKGLVERGTEKRDWSRINRDIGLRYIEHSMVVSHFMVCLTLALRSSQRAEMALWMPQGGPLVYRFSGEQGRHSIDPDGFVSLKSAEAYYNFALEADRSTEAHAKFSPKLAAYWLGQTGYKERLGINQFRVLTICRSPERRDNLAELPAQMDARGTGSRMFLFACESDYQLEQPEAVLGQIWRCGLSSCDKWHSLVE